MSLSKKQKAFVLEYLSNGNNGTSAYAKVYNIPDAKIKTAAQGAYRLLNQNEEIRDYIRDELERKEQERQDKYREGIATIDEALYMLSVNARTAEETRDSNQAIKILLDYRQKEKEFEQRFNNDDFVDDTISIQIISSREEADDFEEDDD